MTVEPHRFLVPTAGPGLYEFTHGVTGWLQEADVRQGILCLFVHHTSCSLLIQENADADVQSDLRAFFDRLVPPSDHPGMSYLRHTNEGPDDMPAHIKASVLPVSLTIPVVSGALALGHWQGIYLFEHRTAPHQRSVQAQFLSG